MYSTIDYTLNEYALHLTANNVLRIGFAIICQWLFSRLFPYRSDSLQSMLCTGGKHSHWHIIAKSIRNTLCAVSWCILVTKSRFILCCKPAACNCAYAHMENYAACALQFACCGLRHTLPQHRPQHRPQHANCSAQAVWFFNVCVRAIAVMFINTQHASEIAENSVALWVEIQRKLKYVQLGAACSLRPVACGKVWTNKANSLILLFVRPAAKYCSRRRR